MGKLLFLWLGVALSCVNSGANVSQLPEVVDLQWVDQDLSRASSLTVLEGLPHPFEGKVRETELKRVPTFEIGGQALYVRELEVSAADRRKLVDLFATKRVFVPPPVRGLPVKFCGGFHADYAIRWEKDDDTLFYTLICFGCGEMRIVKGDVVVTADMTPYGRGTLAGILHPYRQERPPFHLPKASDEARALLPPPPKIDYKP